MQDDNTHNTTEDSSNCKIIDHLKTRNLGLCKEKIKISDDFDELPKDLKKYFT